MGRRELVLIVAFLVVGAIAFQVTSPPSTSSSRVNVGDFFSRIRREMRGTRATAVVNRQFSAPAPQAITRVRLDGFSGRLTVTGGDEDQVAAHLQMQLGGESPEEAAAAAPALVTEWRVDATELVLDVRHPDEWRVQLRRTPGELRITLPRRLAVHLDVDGGVADVSDVAGVTLDSGRTNVTLARVGGKVDGEMSDGRLDIHMAGALDVETRRTVVVADTIAGDARMDASDGSVDLKGVSGAVTLQLRRLRAAVARAAGAVAVEGSDLTVDIAGARARVAVDATRSTITVAADVLAASRIETTDGGITISLPDGAVTVDAQNEVGPIALPEPAGPGQKDGLTERRRVEYGHGGPEIVLRNKRGPITVLRAGS